MRVEVAVAVDESPEETVVGACTEPGGSEGVTMGAMVGAATDPGGRAGVPITGGADTDPGGNPGVATGVGELVGNGVDVEVGSTVEAAAAD